VGKLAAFDLHFVVTPTARRELFVNLKPTEVDAWRGA
jgi:hypothetical protein